MSFTRIVVILAVLSASCTGHVADVPDGGCVGPDCADGSPDACAAMECPEGQVCENGRCLAADPCEGVICANPGEACHPRDGTCVPGGADDDDDGFSIVDGDCDDSDPNIHPRAPEICDGIDQDCDREIDEDIGGSSCALGTTEERSCGNCDDGRQSRSCADCAWSDWESCSLGGSSGACLSCSVDLGTSSDGAYLGSGWHSREDFAGLGPFRWIDGSMRGEVSLGVNPLARTLRIRLGGNAQRQDCSTGDGTRTGSIRIDGSHVADYTVNPITMGWTYHTFSIPASAAADGFLEIEIVSDHFFVPANCGDSPDLRELAVRVESVNGC